MKTPPLDVKEKYPHHFRSRVEHTINLLDRFLEIPKDNENNVILDLGPDNSLRREMATQMSLTNFYEIEGTGKMDLDEDWVWLSKRNNKVITAFEILEHLRNPYMVLKILEAEQLFVTVPLNVWFSKPYWNNKDPYDTHYHEFYPKQLLSLLDKTGWKVEHTEYWKWKYAPLAPRPLLRKYGCWYSWMAVVATKR